MVHVSVREFLRNRGWLLVAGQFPNGSDTELATLNVKDPALARDRSPDPRRHSLNKYVPDLVACKDLVMLIIEMDARYSVKDEHKLEILLSERREDLTTALMDLTYRQLTRLPAAPERFTYVPCLGFGPSLPVKRNPFFCYFRVSGLNEVVFEGNEVLRSI